MTQEHRWLQISRTTGVEGVKSLGGAEEGADPGTMGGVAARRDAALQHSSMQAVKRGCTAGHLHAGHPQ